MPKMARHLLICLVAVSVAAPAPGLVGNDVAGPAQSTSTPPTTNLSRLDNGVVTVLFDLFRGGSIAWVSKSGSSRNLVNVADEGRYIQQSYYAGRRLDRKSEGQSPGWSPWSWNPIQAGDAFGHRARILIATDEVDGFYVKCVPMLWDMNNRPAEAEMEQWTTLHGSAIHVRNRLTCHRTHDAYGEGILNDQELPAVYPISALDKLYTYRGTQPFRGAPLESPAVVNLSSGFWGSYENVTEHWMAFVDDHHWGLGVYNAQCTHFLAGRSGEPGHEATNGSTSYLAPVKQQALLKNSVLEYDYALVLGTLDEIRATVYQLHFAARGK
jgi:hypothetical protein